MLLPSRPTSAVDPVVLRIRADVDVIQEGAVRRHIRDIDGRNPPPPAHLKEVASFFDDLSQVIDAVNLAAATEAPSQRRQSMASSRGAQVRRIQLASPLEVVVDLVPAVVSSASGLGLLIYVVKQLWTIDLDLKTRRLERRAAYLRARQLAQRASSRAEAETIWGSELANSVYRLLDPERDVRWWRAHEATVADWDELGWL